MSRPTVILKCPGELVLLAMAATGSDYVCAINAVHDDGHLIAQERVIKSLTIPEDLQMRLDMMSDDMYVKNISIGPDGEWFLHYSNLNGTEDKAFWDVRNSLCADFLQARFRSNDVGDFIVTFGANLCYIILDDAQGFVMSKNVPENLRTRIMSVRQNKGVVHALSLFPNGGFFIRDSEGIAYAGAPPTLAAEFEEAGVMDVLTVHVATDYSWVVLRRTSLSTCGACTVLQRMLQSHYELQSRYLKQRAAEIRAFDGVKDPAEESQGSSKKKKEKRERGEPKMKAKEPTVKEKSLRAMKKKLLVRRITVAAAKGLKPGVAVTVAGFSSEPGDCIIKSVNGEGVMTVCKNVDQSRRLSTDDPRWMCTHFFDETPSIEIVKLIKATDKYEAAVVSLSCPTCDKKICCCEGIGLSNNSTSMFSRSSENTPVTRDMSDNEGDLAWRNSLISGANSWDGPSLQSEAESEGPLSTSDRKSVV